MLVCKHCSTPNSLDSTFCKKCGTAVPADQRREATLQLDKLVDEGLAALNEGRTSEALAIAGSAIATDPTHLGALHLKSAAHERRGEIADALESADRIVELNPDSELDRIKRNGLRNSLLNVSAPTQPDRRVAFAAAAAAMVLVACAGVLVARRPAPAPAVASNSPAAPVMDPPVSSPPQQAGNVPVVSPPATGTGNVASLGGTPERATGGTESRDAGSPATAYTGTGLPPASGASDLGGPIDPGSQISLPPAKPTLTTVTTNVPKPSMKSGGDPSPTALPQTGETKDDPGQIEIQVSRGSRRMGGGTMIPDTHTNGATAYARVGTERFELGDYSGAAANLEKAVASGGDAVELNRRLAQAYSRLGRNSEAAAAYERCRSAADAALASGKGDKERLQAARDAADAGLRTVKGG